MPLEHSYDQVADRVDVTGHGVWVAIWSDGQRLVVRVDPHHLGDELRVQDLSVNGMQARIVASVEARDATPHS